MRTGFLDFRCFCPSLYTFIDSMNCLSESGTCQAIAQQDPFVKRSRKQHCTFKQISRNVLERTTKRLPASLLHQHQQRNSRKASRKLVTCQDTQLSGPGAWGEAVSASALLVARHCRAVTIGLVLTVSNFAEHADVQGDKNVVLVADIGGTNCRFVLWRLDLKNENHERLFSKAGCSLQLLQAAVSSCFVLQQLHLT